MSRSLSLTRNGGALWGRTINSFWRAFQFKKVSQVLSRVGYLPAELQGYAHAADVHTSAARKIYQLQAKRGSGPSSEARVYVQPGYGAFTGSAWVSKVTDRPVSKYNDGFPRLRNSRGEPCSVHRQTPLGSTGNGAISLLPIKHIHMHTNTHTHTHIHTYTHACKNIYARTHTHTHTHMEAYMHACTVL